MTGEDEAALARVEAARSWTPEGPLPQRPDDLAALIPPDPEEPRVSIITPCHDDGLFLLDAIASVRLCSEERPEMIVVDDHSTDPTTIGILHDLADAGMRVLASEGTGPSAARNTGLARARAELVLPLDADNLLRPGYVSGATHVLDASTDAGAVHGHAMRFGLRTGQWTVVQPTVPDLLCGNQLDTCAVVRRSALEQVGGWDEAVVGSEDWALWVALLAAGWRLATVDHVGFDYRERPGSVRSTLTPAVRRDHFARLVRAHPGLYTAHAEAVILNLSAALTESESRWDDIRARSAQLADTAGPADRRLLDRVAALEQDLRLSERSAEQAWRRVHQIERERRDEHERTDAAAEEHARRLDEARAELEAAMARADAAEAHLTALDDTKLLRFSAYPRSVYARLRGPRR